MEKRYIISGEHFDLGEYDFGEISSDDFDINNFRSYLDKDENLLMDKAQKFEKPLIAYIQNNDNNKTLYIYMISEAGKNEKELEEMYDMIFNFLKDKYDINTFPVDIDIEKMIESQNKNTASKKDLEELNRILKMYEKKGVIKIITNNISNIIENKKSMSIDEFMKKIFNFLIKGK